MCLPVCWQPALLRTATTLLGLAMGLADCCVSLCCAAVLLGATDVQPAQRVFEPPSTGVLPVASCPTTQEQVHVVTCDACQEW